jgi:hypothetical protein
MISSIKRFGLTVVVVGLMAGAVGRAEAAFVIYTESAQFVGTLGGTRFEYANLTFTQTADTNNVVLFDPARSIYEVVNSTATVTITGGTFASHLFATLTVPTITLSNWSGGFGGIVLASDQSDIMLVNSPSFVGYDLRSTIEINGQSFTANFSKPFATDQGDLIFTNSGGFSTFTASVPEPSSLALCGIAGLTGIGFARRLGFLNRV